MAVGSTPAFAVNPLETPSLPESHQGQRLNSSDRSPASIVHHSVQPPVPIRNMGNFAENSGLVGDIEGPERYRHTRLMRCRLEGS
ncbi:hypothetical protein J2S96_000251 [Arthrobacter bambusae]|nr:hypothetical protein [Arthrobacter bambusae]